MTHPSNPLSLPKGMAISADIKPGYETILTPEALAFVASLHRHSIEPREKLTSLDAMFQSRPA